MDAQALIKQLQAQRESWCELAPAANGKPALEVLLRRPPEAELGSFLRGVSIAAVRSYAVNWRGFTEATLLGEAVGSADVLPFDAALWSEVVGDRAAWANACATHLADAIKAHLDRKEAVAKNSEPSSLTPPQA